MIADKICTTVIILSCLLLLAGCASQASKPSDENRPESASQSLAAHELQQAQEMQAAAINAQDEVIALRARIDKLTGQLKAAQDELEACKKKMAEPENWEQKYKKLEADNEELRKLAQYERDLRNDLLKKVQEDQATINELKSQLENR